MGLADRVEGDAEALRSRDPPAGVSVLAYGKRHIGVSDAFLWAPFRRDMNDRRMPGAVALGLRIECPALVSCALQLKLRRFLLPGCQGCCSTRP